MRSIYRRSLSGLGFAILATASASALGQNAEWPHYGNDQSNTRYSTLNQIDARNVQNLKVVWAQSLGSLETQASTLIIVGDTMYATSSTGPRYVFALDPARLPTLP